MNWLYQKCKKKRLRANDFVSRVRRLVKYPDFVRRVSLSESVRILKTHLRGILTNQWVLESILLEERKKCGLLSRLGLNGIFRTSYLNQKAVAISSFYKNKDAIGDQRE